MYAFFLMSQGKIPDAEKYFLNSIKLKPNDAEFKNDYGMFLFKTKKNIKDAYEYLHTSIVLEPKNLDFWLNYLDFLKQHEKRHQFVREAYCECIKIFPNNKFVLQNYGEYLLSVDEIEQSKEIFLKLITKDPNKPRIHFILGKLYYKSKELEVAADYFTKSLNLTEEIPECLFFLGIIHFEKANYKIALDEIIKFIEKLELTDDSIKTGIISDSYEITLAIFNLLILGLINDDKKAILKAKKYLDETPLTPEQEWAYKLINYMHNVLKDDSKILPKSTLINSLNQIFDNKKNKWSFELFMTWIKNPSNKISHKKRIHLVNLIKAIEKAREVKTKRNINKKPNP